MIRRLIISSLILFGLLLQIPKLHPVNVDEKASYQPQSILTLPSIEAQAETIKPDIPVMVNIPAVGISSAIVPMGLTEEKIVETPEFEVGWFTGGVKPGEIGTAALNGHVQNVPARPGVFSNLARVKTGDEVVIIDKQNQRYVYRVFKTELVTVAAFPLQQVYGHTNKALLSIVTCAGKYDSVKNDFSDRTIVYAELVN